jgi:hypothetical protein
MLSHDNTWSTNISIRQFRTAARTAAIAPKRKIVYKKA